MTLRPPRHRHAAAAALLSLTLGLAFAGAGRAANEDRGAAQAAQAAHDSIDLEQAKAACQSGELTCPEGSELAGGKARRSDTLQCRRVHAQAEKHGPSVACSEDGRVRSFGEWRDGKREGRFVTYHLDGSWFEAHFQDGKPHGREVHYFASGKVSVETEYREGRRHGRSRGFRPDGTLMFEDEWVDGKKVGSVFTFRDGRQKRR